MEEFVHKTEDRLPTVILMKNTSQVIHRGPCLLSGAGVTGNGAAGEIDIYDGDNDKAQHKLKLRCINETTFSMNTVHAPQFNYGIYMKVNLSTTFGWIILIPLKKSSKHVKEVPLG